MKVLFVLPVVFFLFLHSMMAQNPNNNKVRIYKIWVIKMNSDVEYGYLYDLSDSTIVLSNTSKIRNYQKKNFSTLHLDVNKIDRIKFRRKGQWAKGVGFGILAGIVTGTTIGLIEGSDPPPPPQCTFLCNSFRLSAGEKAAAYSLALSIPGAIIGGIIGNNIKIKIPINGSAATYQSQKKELRKRAMIRF